MAKYEVSYMGTLQLETTGQVMLSVEQLRSAWDNGPPRGCPSSPGHAPLFCFTCGTWTEYRWGPGGYQACQRCNSRDTIAL